MKRIIAGIMLVVLLLAAVPGNLQAVFAEETPEDLGYTTEVDGLEVWEQVWLTESVTVTEDVVVTGDVKMEPGVSVHVEAGQFIIEGQATVTGDIYIEKSGIITVAGTVKGTVYVNSTDSSVQIEDWDGSLIRASNFSSHSTSSIETVILNGAGNGYIDGQVNYLAVTERYNADYGIGENAVVRKLEYSGKSDIYNDGYIQEAYITGGKSFSNNQGAIIDCLRVTGGCFYNNGLVHYAVLEENGQIYNSNTMDTSWDESLMEYVVVKENVEKIVSHGEQLRNLENHGNITALIAYGGEICTLGDIDYLYADGVEKLFIETCSWRMDHGTDYQVEYLYAEDSEIYFQDWTDRRTQMPKVRSARIENGYIYARDILAEELYLSGSFSGFHLERTEIYDLYVNELELTEQMHVDAPTPNEVVITDFKASPEAQDAYELVTAQVNERLSKEDQELLKKFMFETAELPTLDREISEHEFTKTLKQYESITIEFKSASAIGAVLVESPSGYEFMVMSKDDTAVRSFLAYESGEYRFRIIGDDYGAECKVDTAASSKLDVDVYTQYAVEEEEAAQKEKDSLNDYRVSIFDITEGREVTGYTINGQEIIFQENPAGHEFSLTLTSISMNWEWEDETVMFSLEAGETKQLEVVMKQFGDYYGYTQDGTIPQVYLYDADGTFIRQCDTDAHGNFWAGRLPSGEYTAILLRDEGGNYKFSRLSEYEAYGMTEKEDYLKDSFMLLAGENINYPDILLPEAPQVENLYFDTEVTAFNTNRQITVAGELIQLTLDYAFKADYASKVSGLMFLFSLDKEAELKEGSITVNGAAVSDYALEDGCLIVPADETTGSICFQLTAAKTDRTLVTKATAEFILGSREHNQFLGNASTFITDLTLKVPDIITSNELIVTGYTSPEQPVSILDNGQIVGTLTSNASGYYSGTVLLEDGMLTRHKISAARQFGTPSEVRTAEQVVSIHESAPDVTQFHMYYYVHGHSARFELTGEEFKTRRFTYDYWPGSVFTFEIKMSHSEKIEQLYVVSNNGSVKKLEAFYEPDEDIWVASGIFSEDENYAPADFDIEYLLKEIDIETEIGDFSFWKDLSIDAELIDRVYGAAEKEISDYVFDNDTNSVSSTVDVSAGNQQYSCDYELTYQETKETRESLLAQGYEVEEIDGTEYFYKFELDYDTMMMTATSLVLYEPGVETARADELVLFSNAGPVMMSQQITTNVSDVVGYQAAGMPKNAFLEVCDKIPDFVDAMGEFGDQMEAFEPITGVDEFFTEEESKFWDGVKDAAEWVNSVTGYEHRQKQEEYFNKLRELERKLDQIEQARMNGRGGKCAAALSLGSFYDGISAAYNSAGNITNAKWSFDMLKKVITSAADYTVSKGKVKVKQKDGSMVDAKLEDVLKIPGIELDDLGGMDRIIGGEINVMIDKINDFLSISNLYEKGMDWMAGDTLEYWDNANTEYLKQMEKNIDLLLKAVEGASGEDEVQGAGSGTGCFDPSDVDPFPGGSVPGGGGDVRWDPSGYVFEGVPSNRLPGVTATTYYRGEDGSEIQWNAEEYGQINPQITDGQGCYGWFVPEGEWKVVYVKDGYEVAETEWLPVPPPQTEVNAGMVSQEAPVVKNVMVSQGSALVTFSKYVTADRVSDVVLYVKNITGTVEAVNAEEGTDGTMLASKFRITFTEPLTVGNEYTVVVKDGISGYNGKNVPAGEWSAYCAIQPESISAELPDYLATGEETTIRVTVLAEGGFDAMNLECVTDETFLEVVSIGKLSETGMAEVVVQAKKAGVSALKIGVTGSDADFEQEIVTASGKDTGLMKYVEREKNQPVDAPAEDAPVAGPVVLWVVLAAVILVLAAVICIVCVKKRKKTA